MSVDDVETDSDSHEDDTDQTGSASGESSGSASDDTGEGSVTDGDKGSAGDSESDLKRELAAAKREAAKFRKERNTAKSELDKIQAEKLSETEREKLRADSAEKKLSESTKRIQEANLRVALSTAKSPIVDIDTAAMWLNKRGIEYDEDGSPLDVDKAISTLVADKPFLVGKATRTGSNTNGGAGGDDSETTAGLTADELLIAKQFKMSPADYAKWKEKP
jgi:phage I-like protein